MTTSSKQLIVALDVQEHDEALDLVRTLDNVSFFKIGLRLLLAGDLFGFLKSLHSVRGSQVFIDLKIAGDITNTIGTFVDHAADLGIRFMTFVAAAEPAITKHTLAAGRATRGEREHPKFIVVPMLSSIDATDKYIVGLGKSLLDDGFDGLVASGTSTIAALRGEFPNVPIISPGIRPTWYGSADDHLRHSTPAEAIRAGADYIVVGRPILNAADKRAAAQLIIDEIGEAASKPVLT